jgi:Arc/MetJ family transcription regulator
MRYLRAMAKTSVELDRDIVREAADILGTTTLRATIDAALHEVVHAKRRLELIAMLAQEGRFDFDVAEGAWGGAE